MRASVSFDRIGWLNGLDHRKIILIAFLARFICAATYDCYVSVTGRDIIVPDGKFYSVRGRYASLFFDGYDAKSFTKDYLPEDREGKKIFWHAMKTEGGRLPLRLEDESTVFTYIVGLIYTIFGHFPFWVRLFNIVLSITSAYLIFDVGRKHFGILTANIFLIVALFLPTQFIYSISQGRDFLRVFMISLIIWVVYG
jgi:hypothetical protein